MLLKVEAIEEIGRFVSLKHKGPQFGRLSLVFARNGYGKSTLCAVLRSVAEQNPNLIEARRKLGAVAESRVHLNWNGGAAVTFATGKWNTCPGDICVFDQEYVRRNLHVGESVTRDNKRSLLPVVLGDGGVALIEKISSLDAEQRDLSQKQAASERAIRAACPIVSEIKPFASASVPDDIDAQIDVAAKHVELARHALTIQQKPDLAKLPVPNAAAIQELGQKSLEDVANAAQATVDAHIQTHAMTQNGARWLEYGVKHMDGATCPFCTQNVVGNATVEAFRGYFSSEFAALSAEIDSTLEALGHEFGDDGSVLRRALDQNATDIAFWKTVCELPEMEPLTEAERNALVAAYAALIELLNRKRKSPLSSLSLDQPDAVLKAISDLATYQQRISAANVAVATARGEVQGADVERAQEILSKRKALKAKLAQPLSDDVASWLAGDRRRDEIASEKAAAQDALRTFVRDTVGARQVSINELLALFGANFRIAETKASFVGREPNTDFSIAIGPHVVKAGERSEDKPSFTTMLSAGDKFTLALAFFITQLRGKPNLSDCAIVFDDPFSSQDMDRQFETTSQIRALAKDACQVLVLSHDPRFLHLIEKNAPASSSFQILCDDSGTGSIRSWSSEDELKDVYIRQAERIREFASTGNLLKDVTQESLAKDLRPFLEGFLRARFPGRFGPLVMLDGMTNEIEAAGASDPAYKDITALRALNEFSRDQMHAGSNPPAPAALRAQCARIIAIIGSY